MRMRTIITEIWVMKNNRALLGLSGGVDSTAAALLLKEQGYEVIGYYFDVLPEQGGGKRKAERAAEQLHIDFVYRNVAQEFEDQVIQPFCRAYEQGRTPNPCVICNPSVKFYTMAQEADRAGASWIATGHYARIAKPEKDRSFFRVRMAVNRRKDQSYMLYRLPQEILRRLLLPLGEISDKETVRQLVRDFGVFNADASDSQEICFIPDGDYVDYLSRRGIRSVEGDFIDSATGQVIGRHRGVVCYTVGQRKGLGATFGMPRFVTKIDAASNQVTLGANEDLFSAVVTAEDWRFFGSAGQEGINLAKSLVGRPLLGKIRYAAVPSECVIHSICREKLEIAFQTPQRAITPGQSVVLYDGEYLVGGGFITGAEPT